MDDEEKVECLASVKSEEKLCSEPQSEADSSSQIELPGLQPDLAGSLALLAKAIEAQTKESARTNDLIVNMLAQTAAFIEMIGEQQEEDEDLGLYLDNSPAPPRRRGA